MSRKTASVVLVGRPNVGKSTLFNRISGSRRAIVAPIAGTTRDSLALPVSWQDAYWWQELSPGGIGECAAKDRRPRHSDLCFGRHIANQSISTSMDYSNEIGGNDRSSVLYFSA